MANKFYTPEQAAVVTAGLVAEDAFLSGLVGRNLENDLLGGGGRGRTVNIKVPTALIARERGIDDKTSNIILDELSETTVPVTLGTHAYSAVSLSEGDLSLDLKSFADQVLAPQADAVADFVEHEVAEALMAENEDASIGYDPADPVKTFTKMRATLRKRGVPISGLNVVAGVNVYADLLDNKLITDASQSGSTAALRDGNIGSIRGFSIVESTRVGDDDIFAFHRDAFVLAVRPPVTSPGAKFGATVNAKGFALRYLRDYLTDKTVDRSMVSTFVGVAKMPLYRVERDYSATTAKVLEVPQGAVLRVNTATPAA